jgi:hypothetical protein
MEEEIDMPGPDLIPALTAAINAPGYWQTEALDKLRAAVVSETCAMCKREVPVAEVATDADEWTFCPDCWAQAPRQCDGCDCWAPDDDLREGLCETCRIDGSTELCGRHPDTRAGYGI